MIKNNMKMKKRDSRSTDCPFFGGAKPLPTSTLPSIGDVMRHYQFIRSLLKVKSGKDTEHEISEIVDFVAYDVEQLWRMAKVTPKKMSEIKLKVRDLYDGKGQKKNKPIKGRLFYKKELKWYKQSLEKIHTETNQNRLNRYRENSKKLFDIGKCNDPKKVGTECDCDTCDSMLEEDLEFLFALRNGKYAKISPHKDVEGTEELEEIEKEANQLRQELIDKKKRKHENEKQIAKRLKQSSELIDYDSDENDETVVEDKRDIDYSPGQVQSLSQRNHLKIRNFIIACIYGNVSTAICAYQATGLFIDADQISDIDRRFVFTVSKIRDWKTRIRREFLKNHFSRLQNLVALGIPLICISFDSKKERQLRKSLNENSRYSRSLEYEEHYTILEHEFRRFITSITVKKPQKELKEDENDRMISEITEEQIMNFFTNNQIDLSHVRAAACDGTNSNTGWENGIIRRMEQRLNRPLQWIICIIHLVELTLKNLLIALLGPKRVKGFSGHPLGTEITLEDLHLRPVVDFEKIPVNDFPIYRKNDREEKLGLTSDQDIFYLLCLAVITGEQTYIDTVKNYKLGQIGHARWLTTAIRILRIYISRDKPDEVLKTIVAFIVNVYGFVYFDCKKRSSFVYGSQHYFNLFARSRNLSQKAQSSIQKTLTTNSYWAHPENVAIAMLGDEDVSVKHEAVRLITKARVNNEIRIENLKNNPVLKGPKKTLLITNSQIRFFIKPTPENESKLDFNSSHYSQMVDMENNCNEPPLTIGVRDLFNFVLPNLKGDTQATERFVQMVNKSCGDVTEDDLRNANVLIKEHFLQNVEQYKK